MDPLSTAKLLERARSGDDGARNELFARFLPILRRWAHGRLPTRIQGPMDTEDVVQISLLRAFSHLDDFEPRHEGAFLAYLRKIFLNEIRQELRRVVNRPAEATLGSRESPGPSPLEELLGREALESYELGLMKLSEEQRIGVILRVEFGFSHAQIAEATGSVSPAAARMSVKRAILKLAEVMEHEKRRR